MKNALFPKLAAQNLRKNSSVTLPYFITCILTTAVYYDIRSLSLNPGMDQMLGANTLSQMLELGSYVAFLFSVVFLLYTNSFLVKRRRKEFGMYNILGMEKRHLVKVLFWETLCLLAGSLAVGLLLGIALDKLLFLTIGRIVGAQYVPMGFFISGKAVTETLLLFSGIALLVFAKTAFTIRVTDPIRMLREGQAGEKEPKANWFLAVLGVVLTAAGYWISIRTENPMMALPMFFVAVLMVIAGTYLLFVAGSVALLKTLRRSKKFYYKSNHFISVSGLLYRMKQNAMGLASICVLSTMVLVMLSGTGSLMVGMEDALHQRHPYEIVLELDETEGLSAEQLVSEVDALCKENGIQIEKAVKYHELTFPAEYVQDGFLLREPQTVVNPAILMCMPLSDYNAAMGTQKSLEADEVMVYCERMEYTQPTLRLMDKVYTVKEVLDKVPGNNFLAMNVITGYVLVLPDEELHFVEELQKQNLGRYASEPAFFYGFDSNANEEKQLEFYNILTERLTKELEYNGELESRAESRVSFNGLYGGFFFVGVFLGVLFLVATVLIIYYKQISEGMDDRSRYAILRKVGMDDREIKRAIHSQILIVFFLPLAVSFCHVAAAFPLVTRLLAILNLTNKMLYLGCTGVTCLLFAAFYLLVYALTAKTYYKLVSSK